MSSFFCFRSWLVVYLADFMLHPSVFVKYKIRTKDGEMLTHGFGFYSRIIRDAIFQGVCELLFYYRTFLRFPPRYMDGEVVPLFHSIRGQGDSYNRSLPYYRYEDGSLSGQRMFMGYVATCIGQVLSNYRYPVICLIRCMDRVLLCVFYGYMWVFLPLWSSCV